MTPRPVGRWCAAATDAAQILQERLGVDLPLASLRYWILGVPDPDEPSTVSRNAMTGRAAAAGWLDHRYWRYVPWAATGFPAN